MSARAIFGEEEEEDVAMARARNIAALKQQQASRELNKASAAPVSTVSVTSAKSTSNATSGNPARTTRDYSYLLDTVSQKVKDQFRVGGVAESVADDDVIEDVSDVAGVLGFGGFGKKDPRAQQSQTALNDALKATRRVTQMASSSSSFSRDDDADADGEADDDVGPQHANAPAAASKQSRSEDAHEDARSSDAEDSGEDDDESGGIEAQDSLGVPISNEVTLSHGAKPVSAMSLDPSGARLVTGSYDAQVQLWDFAGMNKEFHSFRNVEPFEKTPIRSLEYSKTGDMILITTAHAQAKVLDRDGHELLTCLKGDQYLLDLAKTHGHVASINAGLWHPHNREWFTTFSSDSTVRIWDINNHRKSLFAVKARTAKGQRAPVMSGAINKDGSLMAGGCEDGSLRLWSFNKIAVKPTLQKDFGHSASISGLAFSRDGSTLLSRSTDHSLRAWDLRKFKDPLHVVQDLPCFYDLTDVLYSPDEKYIMTGTSSLSDKESGRLVFLNSKTFEKEIQLGFAQASVIRALWHPRLNQIMVSTSAGAVKVFFDAEKSFRGVKLSVAKAPRKPDPLDFDGTPAIFTPHAGGVFREREALNKTSTKRKLEKMRADPVASHKPEAPVAGTKQGKQGRTLGYSSSLSQHIAKQLAYDKTRDVDPREAILAVADRADQNPYWAAAYQKTQPVTIFDTNELLSEEEDNDNPAKRKPFNPLKKPT
eukprot:m.726596 g.726596  ORF g.726596 m.726596 type:complete len:709 (-) comp58859_c0_seq3:1749-3875(-)